MPMTKGQATHVNMLLRWLLELPGDPVNADQARHAAGELAEGATRALAAGVRPADVSAAWPAPDDPDLVAWYPCAYCRRPTLLGRAAAGPWMWPGRGEVVNCRSCAGIETCRDCGTSWDSTLASQCPRCEDEGR